MRLSSIFLIAILFSACHKDQVPQTSVDHFEKGMLVLCEGLFQQNNSSLSWINKSSGEVELEFFTAKNGRLLGDTGNDMQRYGGKIYIVVNNSNTLEIISATTGKSIKQVTMYDGAIAKQPRNITFYEGNAFITCYDGYVDILDTASLSITQRIKVGSNPEGLVVAQNKLFVSNSGGLAGSIGDSTVSIIDLSTFQETTKLTVGRNPGAIVLDAEGEIYVIARGNYSNIPSRMVRIDTQNENVLETFPFDASGMCKMGNNLLVTYYNYATHENQIRLFDAQNEVVLEDNFISTSQITTLYGIYYYPNSNKIYCLDAMGFVNTGYVRQYSASGVYEKSFHVGLNPSKIIFYE
jgi:hypothetical protein